MKRHGGGGSCWDILVQWGQTSSITVLSARSCHCSSQLSPVRIHGLLQVSAHPIKDFDHRNTPIGLSLAMYVGHCPFALGQLPATNLLPIRPFRSQQSRRRRVLNSCNPSISIWRNKGNIRAQSVKASQVTTQTVVRFSKKDEESVRRSLLPLISGELTSVSTAKHQNRLVWLFPLNVAACTAAEYSQDPVAQYFSPSKSEFESTLKAGLQVQLSEAQAADLLFQAADFAAAAWCYKVPEELVGLQQQQHAYPAHKTAIPEAPLAMCICSH